ncbi:NAD-dependent epimerase/dehydratase family protein [Candidatus Oscillochloris fontis]|uniref:NAD-dependent epimerase/dehydratase family protein n=1 Tax=Candidatus Oscillochloris fontis TaxID=2496868 RepID=UPI00101C003B|nr:NAD-dependent epimerase/dehydratase family protein [Candidatus Oscillochloris fontis]
MSSTARRVLITGSSGLIGSEAVTYFDQRGWDVHGVDNNMRRDFFGPDGDTTWNLERLRHATRHFTHHNQDIRDRAAMLKLMAELHPDLIIHCASQPSHDLAKDRPFDDFDVNAVGTLNLLEATRRSCPESPFIFMSTNKVYGDAPNEIPLVEQATRWEYARPEDYHGVSESCRIDACLHSLFGASKVAADVMVQEYGRYFNMPTVCLRGGCLTGPNHSGAELHGFLAYLARAVREGRTYRIFGYKGKQVRDNIHSYDVCTFFEAFYHNPRIAAVYNLCGGRENSVSMLEAISRFEDLIGKRLDVQYVDENRVGDHICYISDLRRIHADYPTWRQEYTLERTFAEISRGPQGDAA